MGNSCLFAKLSLHLYSLFSLVYLYIVSVVPHITDAIQEWVSRVAQVPVCGNEEPQVCIVELGGTIGDIEGMPFVEAFRQFQFRVKRENFCCAHVSLVPSVRINLPLFKWHYSIMGSRVRYFSCIPVSDGSLSSQKFLILLIFFIVPHSRHF